MKILFICTHNRCRSILAEAIANHFGAGLIVAASAGSQPAGKVHPLTLKYLTEHQIPVAHLQSQSWDNFETFKPDIVITVCDNAAQETCPIWFGKTHQMHWGLVDPSKISGNTQHSTNAFAQTIAILTERILNIRAHLEAGKTIKQILDLGNSPFPS